MERRIKGTVAAEHLFEFRPTMTAGELRQSYFDASPRRTQLVVIECDHEEAFEIGAERS